VQVTVDFLHLGRAWRAKPGVKTKPAKPKPRVHRPRLTRAVIEGLCKVHSDADVHVMERVACGDSKPNDIEYRGLEYLDDLIHWYFVTHPEALKRR